MPISPLAVADAVAVFSLFPLPQLSWGRGKKFNTVDGDKDGDGDGDGDGGRQTVTARGDVSVAAVAVSVAIIFYSIPF